MEKMHWVVMTEVVMVKIAMEMQPIDNGDHNEGK
jgi:hypothetical protein